METMLKVTAKKELREFVMNFLLDERMCSSKALFEVVVGEVRNSVLLTESANQGFVFILVVLSLVSPLL